MFLDYIIYLSVMDIFVMLEFDPVAFRMVSTLVTRLWYLMVTEDYRFCCDRRETTDIDSEAKYSVHRGLYGEAVDRQAVRKTYHIVRGIVALLVSLLCVEVSFESQSQLRESIPRQKPASLT